MDRRAGSGGRRNSVWPGLRQWRFPAEFRIAPAVWPAELSAELDRIEQLRLNPLPAERPTAAPPTAEPWDEGALAQAVTSLWRAQRKVESEDSVGPMRQIRWHVQTTWESMAVGLGVKVLNHDNEPFDPGLSLDVLAIQPQAGISRETIIETVKPTIYLGDRRIQLGQVIVGRPEEREGS